VMHYLQSNGYRILPVNPGLAGQTILGERVHESLAAIPGSFDMVDIFRMSDAVPAIVEDAVSLAPDKGISVIWMQLGVFNIGAAERAKAASFDVIMNRCPKIEHQRLIAS
ncbi:MAG: CoA-binding protein, partial [Rhodospirillales bacterium]|nr:CoA-binding protein [Rhodospirillales bacterium]